MHIYQLEVSLWFSHMIYVKLSVVHFAFLNNYLDSCQRRMEYINFRQIKGTMIYRGSNPDCLSKEQVEILRDIGIRSIIDLRWDT